MSVGAIKASRVLQASATNSAGGTTTGSAVDIRTALGILVTGKVVNGGTGPTAGCEFVVQVSGDGSDWREYSRQRAGTTASATYEFVVEIGPMAMYVRSVFTGNTGQSVTVEAKGQELSGIGG